jgi:hypothetical protein
MELELEQRLRSPAPTTAPVVPGSTPVPAFGDFRTARVATLGLNPSRAEFLDDDGEILRGQRARFVTLPALGITSLKAASPEDLAQVLEGTAQYFQNQPYVRWFRPLDSLLRACGVSYFDGSACHLDLAHWATDPVWGGLEPPVRKALIKDGVDFLRWQLTSFRIANVLLNGMGVCRTVEKTLGVLLAEVEAIAGPRGGMVKLLAGRMARGPRFFGWSVNLQSSFGVTTEFRARLATRVAGHIASA